MGEENRVLFREADDHEAVIGMVVPIEQILHVPNTVPCKVLRWTGEHYEDVTDG